jgi:hypothetical protein
MPFVKIPFGGSSTGDGILPIEKNRQSSEIFWILAGYSEYFMNFGFGRSVSEVDRIKPGIVHSNEQLVFSIVIEIVSKNRMHLDDVPKL